MTNKKLIAGLLAVSMLPVAASAATVEELQAQINALMAQLGAAKPAATASCSYNFTKTLKQGMSDQEVMNLQKVLNADVATQVSASGVGSAGNETMYFGAATKAALVKYQEKYASDILAPAGLTKGTGMVGAATRAQLNKYCAGTPSTPTTPGTTTQTGDLKGGAGTFSLVTYTSDVEDTVVTGDSEIILSWKGKAEGSDVKVTNIKLTFTAASSSLSTYLNRYFTSFDVYAAGKKVGSVDAADFSRDSSGVYSKTVALTDAIVRMGSSNQVIFTVKANAVDTIDSVNVPQDWTAKVSDVRYADATGVILTSSDTKDKSGISVEKLGASGDVKVKVSSGSGNPDEKIVFVSEDNSGDKVTMNEFKIKSEGTSIKFDTLKASFAMTGTANTLAKFATEILLMKGDTTIDTVDPLSSEVAGSVITFNLDNQETINKDETVTYKIVAKMQKVNTATFAIGDTLAITYTSINAEDKNGDGIASSKYSGSSSGKAQTFRATGIDMTKSSQSATAVASTVSGKTGYGTFVMDLKITASGDDLWIPLTTNRGASSTVGIAFQMENSSGAVVSTGTTTAAFAVQSGGSSDTASGVNYVKIADGASATVRITVSYDPLASGFAKMQVLTVGYNTSAANPNATITATPQSGFETDSVDVRL